MQASLVKALYDCRVRDGMCLEGLGGLCRWALTVIGFFFLGEEKKCWVFFRAAPSSVTCAQRVGVTTSQVHVEHPSRHLRHR